MLRLKFLTSAIPGKSSTSKLVNLLARSFSNATTTAFPGPQTIDLNISKARRQGRPVYLDVQATTQLDFRAADAMLPFLTSMYGNPHSKSHEFGWICEEAVEKGRAKIARLINADPLDITFTSGATESNNAALKGLARFYKDSKRHIITSVTEHKCVLDTCRHLELEGCEVTYLPVQPNGLIDLELLKKSIRPDTLVVSIMTLNNEIGVIQDIKEIGKICRERKVFFHTDAAQALGKIPMDVDEMNIDLMSMSGHKIYGPKGVGALYVRRKPRVRILPLINGGGQEKGLRSGTLAPALCVGFGKACEVAMEEMQNDSKHIKKLFTKLYNGIVDRIPHIRVNGDLERRYYGNLNVSFAYVEGESLIMALKNICVSSGSACTSSSLEPSYVLRALGVEDEIAHSSLRFGLGRFTTEQEIDFLLDQLVLHVDRLRKLSPLWELVQEGIDLKTIEWSQPH